MDQIEPQVKQMLNGGGNTEDITYCDFTLADQNEALGS